MHKLSILLLVLIIGGCSSGKKQLTRGNYELAMNQAVNRLKNQPNNRRAQEAIADAYPYHGIFT